MPRSRSDYKNGLVNYAGVSREWYGRGDGRGLRGEVVQLVGSLRKDGDPILHTPAAYGVAYDTVFNALNGR